MKDGTSPVKIYYTYTDYLGSILEVTDSVGAVIARQNFDPWGRHRNAVDWSYDNISAVPDWLYRGFTGHEELSEFGVINMNGRMYDPIQGRMLAPDKFVVNVLNSQAYNRFSYALNNPLVYVDPSGFLAEHSTDPNDYWSGWYNGGDANILPDFYVGGSPFNNSDIADILWDYSQGEEPLFYGYNYEAPNLTLPGSSGGGGGGGYSGGGSNGRHRPSSEVAKVNTNGNVKAYNDAEATSNAPKVLDAVEKSVAIAADTHNTVIASVARYAVKAENVSGAFVGSLKTLSRPGTIIGVVAGGVPSAINIVNDLWNGRSVKTRDVVNVVLSVAALAVGGSGFGSVISVVASGASLINDFIEFFNVNYDTSI